MTYKKDSPSYQQNSTCEICGAYGPVTEISIDSSHMFVCHLCKRFSDTNVLQNNEDKDLPLFPRNVVKPPLSEYSFNHNQKNSKSKAVLFINFYMFALICDEVLVNLFIPRIPPLYHLLWLIYLLMGQLFIMTSKNVFSEVNFSKKYHNTYLILESSLLLIAVHIMLYPFIANNEELSNSTLAMNLFIGLSQLALIMGFMLKILDLDEKYMKKTGKSIWGIIFSDKKLKKNAIILFIDCLGFFFILLACFFDLVYLFVQIDMVINPVNPVGSIPPFGLPLAILFSILIVWYFIFELPHRNSVTKRQFSDIVNTLSN
ncbi:MAG: hypothetical protein ACFFD1_06070 [Candidatus Thorarchaeota archaeon]